MPVHKINAGRRAGATEDCIIEIPNWSAFLLEFPMIRNLIEDVKQEGDEPEKVVILDVYESFHGLKACRFLTLFFKHFAHREYDYQRKLNEGTPNETTVEYPRHIDFENDKLDLEMCIAYRKQAIEDYGPTGEKVSQAQRDAAEDLKNFWNEWSTEFPETRPYNFVFALDNLCDYLGSSWLKTISAKWFYDTYWPVKTLDEITAEAIEKSCGLKISGKDLREKYMSKGLLPESDRITGVVTLPEIPPEAPAEATDKDAVNDKEEVKAN